MNTDNITPNELLDEEPPLFAIASDEDETVEDMENHEQSVQADEGISAEEVAELRGLGLSDAEIAEILGVESLADELTTDELTDIEVTDIELTADELTDIEVISSPFVASESTNGGEVDKEELATNESCSVVDESTKSTENKLTTTQIINNLLDNSDDKSEDKDELDTSIDIDIDLDDDTSRTVIHPAGMLYSKNTETPKTKETDLANEEVVQEEVVQEEVIQEEVIQEEVIQEEVVQEEVVQEEVVQEEVVQEEVVQEEVVQEEVVQEEVVQEEVVQEEVVQEEVVQEEVVQEEVVQEEVVQEEPLSEIEELRGLGLSDEEICHILEIDSLDDDNSNNMDSFADDIIDDVADKAETQTTEQPAIEPIDDSLVIDKDNNTESKAIIESKKANEEVVGSSKLDNKHISVGKNVGKTAPALLLAYADKQFLTFPTQSLLELIESPELTALPSGKDFVYGLLHWQDKLVPVIDLAVLLKERTIKTTTEINQPTQLSNELSSELSNKKVAFVMVTAYHTAEGIAHIAVKLDEPPVSVLVNNTMACELATNSDINWADYAISCFSYQNNPVPILQPELLFV